MSVNRSDKYYFARGDLVIQASPQVEDTLFRLHRDILEMHSGFFEDMFTMPTNDDSEGTEENPLLLPTDLCSAQAFATLCKFLYPQRMAHFPRVSVKNIEEWEPVLKATVTLQMKVTREYIWGKLNLDASNIKSNAVELLRLSMEYEEASHFFINSCLRILGYRRKRITPHEVSILGEKTTCLVNHTRERIRESLFKTLAEFSRSTDSSITSTTGTERVGCKKIVLQKIVDNLSDKKAQSMDESPDIFRIDGHHGICVKCIPKQSSFVQSFKSTLNDVVESCVDEFLSTSNAAEAHANSAD
ncbi:hypothetical protein FRC11_002211 [Ceratobasidium sp. 423]|nr:hypothetical protein FRC11_002211 [Ceratobasidium sp. 423]